MYSRTSNDNGSLNSRCLYCFATISTATDSTIDLDRIEVRHICPEKALAYSLTRGHTFELRPENRHDATPVREARAERLPAGDERFLL
jgi:hypothetical protein